MRDRLRALLDAEVSTVLLGGLAALPPPLLFDALEQDREPVLLFAVLALLVGVPMICCAMVFFGARLQHRRKRMSLREAGWVVGVTMGSMWAIGAVLGVLALLGI